MRIEPELLLEELKAGKNQRAKTSLDRLNTLLKTHFEANEKDFCIATIGRLSKEQNGISTISIRNKSGMHYRRLIEAWAVKADTNMKKPHALHSRKREVPSDNQLLERLDDPALRVIFGQIIAERNQLQRENRVLKSNIEVVVDIRPTSMVNAQAQTHNYFEVLPALAGLFLPSEIDALKAATSDVFIARQGWKVKEDTGAVLDINNRPLFKAGFVTAIKKILRQAL
ncbi:MAG: hypothetical protein HRT37_18185 [Alteromonadaceae bacterium]|nr:hypothetical protein [Alteromonadaceae bacterium]